MMIKGEWKTAAAAAAAAAAMDKRFVGIETKHSFLSIRLCLALLVVWKNNVGSSSISKRISIGNRKEKFTCVQHTTPRGHCGVSQK